MTQSEGSGLFVGSDLGRGITPAQQKNNWTDEATGHLSDRTRMQQSDDPNLQEEVDAFHRSLQHHSNR